MGGRPLGVIVAASCVLAATAHAQAITGDDLARKNDGGYVTGLPLFSYSTDLGYGFGARAYYYWNGHRGDSRFSTTPYLYRVFLQAFVSTRGTQFHWLDFDAPKIFDSPYRVRSQIIYQRDTSQNYFGVGSRTLQPLAFPGSPKTFSTFSDYSAAEDQVTNGTTWSRYDEYDLTRPIAIASVERLFDHDHVRVLGGLGFSYASINDYSGKQVDAIAANGTSTTATEGTTRLEADCAAGAIVGCQGGRDDYVRVAASYDTRDFEPDPNTGVFIDAEVDAATVALASQYDYIRALFAARGFYSPIPDKADLVLAGRFTFVGQTNGAPFFSMDTFPYTDNPIAGLGGGRTLRGYRQDRFVGSLMTVTNGEVRWTFAHACFWRQKFAFIIVPFIDIGRPFDNFGQLTFADWKPSYGGAFRVSWNLATIASVDYGVSPEDTGLYINFNHIF
ncbi:MAG TPA: DUF5982 domain-containing protein [Kofleriaceae bacterium]